MSAYQAAETFIPQIDAEAAPDSLASILPGPTRGLITPQLSMDEKKMVLLASFGKSLAAHFTQPEIDEGQSVLQEKFEVPNMAAVVNMSILHQILTIRRQQPRNSAKQVQLTPRDFTILQIFAAGGGNNHIRQATGEKSRNKVVTWNKRLFQKLTAQGRAHSVRRAYEIGAFYITDEPVTLDQILRAN